MIYKTRPGAKRHHDMVVVATIDPLQLQTGNKLWCIEKANLVADFIASLPRK